MKLLHQGSGQPGLWCACIAKRGIGADDILVEERFRSVQIAQAVAAGRA
jgi:hypothetical protein